MVVNKLMEKEKSLHKIVLIGAGNLATNLGKVLVSRGYSVVQVYSRTEESAKELATTLSAAYTTSLDEVRKDATLYIVSLKDSALIELLPEIVADKQDSFFVHTAGSISMDIWKGYVKHYGVFYPMQTFSKSREVDFCRIPIFLEANEPSGLSILREIANELSVSVHEVSSEQRRYLHLSAVFACNFTNHMYTLTEKLLNKYGIPFDVMLPLIDETANKIHELSPEKAQTGPAVRYDLNVINKQLELLSDEPEMRQLYELISKDIHRINENKR